MKGLRNIAWAVLRSALSDALRGDLRGIETFIMSDWCEDLCSVVGLPYTAYKREMAKRVTKSVDNCRPKRIKTYKLVEVLKYGKDTRAGAVETDR